MGLPLSLHSKFVILYHARVRLESILYMASDQTRTAAVFPPEYFARVDESDDAAFYTVPRLVVHIDDAAIATTTALFRDYLPADGDILDLMSSWRSHLPGDMHFNRVVGLGMNEVELRENQQLSEYSVRNLNVNPALPFGDATFDACVLTVSVQYLIHPVDVYAEVGRVLRLGAPFITVFSNRLFPTKAVAAWRSLDDRGHAQLVSAYYQLSGMFAQIEFEDRSPSRCDDPLYAVIGRRIDK